jgi:hypothetical protein
MTDKPESTPPRKPPYDFGPNSRDVTAERAGTVVGIVGYPRPQPDAAPSPTPAPAPPERK